MSKTHSGIRITWQPMIDLPVSAAAALEAADGTVYGEVARQQPRGPRSWTWYVPSFQPQRPNGAPLSGYAATKAAAQRACEQALRAA